MPVLHLLSWHALNQKYADLTLLSSFTNKEKCLSYLSLEYSMAQTNYLLNAIPVN